MSPGEWTILLFVGGIILLLAELFLPTHGLLGVLGCGAVLASIGTCFVVNRWLGLAMLVACVGAAPFIGSWVVRVWPRTPIGRRLVLQPVEPKAEPLAVQIGQTGLTISELRPMGQCEFDGQRVEALSECGIIEPGKPVKVVGLNNRRPIVRQV